MVQVVFHGLVKGGAVHLRVIVADAVVQKAVLQPEDVPHPQGVGQRQLALLGVLRQAHAVGIEVVVEGIPIHAHGLLQLGQRGAGGAVGGHAQCVQQGYRGEQHALLLRCLPQQGGGKVHDSRAVVGQVDVRIDGAGGHALRQALCRQLTAAAEQRQRHARSQHQRRNAFSHEISSFLLFLLLRRRRGAKGFPRREKKRVHAGGSPSVRMYPPRLTASDAPARSGRRPARPPSCCAPRRYRPPVR